MSESPAGVGTDLYIGVQNESSISQVKKKLFDPRIISKMHDQEGKDALAGNFRQIKKEKEEIRTNITNKESELQTRQENILVKLKQKLNIPDKRTIELQAQILEARTKQDRLPDPKQMVEAYYEKISETPLTNQEKRDLLKPEILENLSTNEYIALWKRINPYFVSHVTKQGFEDHYGLPLLTGGLYEFHNGFTNLVNDEKKLRPQFAIQGLRDRNETSVKIFLSNYVLQSENEVEAKKRFDTVLHEVGATASEYSDKTSVHLATQVVSNNYYGAETGNEIFFIYPTDVLASQYNFYLNGLEKTLIQAQSERRRNDVFVWSNTLENPGISINAGIVFLPEKSLVDPNTGSKYASEIKIVNGKEQRVMIEDTELINKFAKWVNELNDQSPVIKKVREFRKEYDTEKQLLIKEELDNLCIQQLRDMGFYDDIIDNIFTPFSFFRQTLLYPENASFRDDLYRIIYDSKAKYKRAENTVSAKDYWENFFDKNPNHKPKHVIYYDGDPTTAVYRFQQENKIGAADTSKTEGQLLGFDDHFVSNMETDQRANRGHQELINLGNKIIEEHYRNKI